MRWQSSSPLDQYPASVAERLRQRSSSHPGMPGYDPPSPNDLLTTTDVQALLAARRRRGEPQRRHHRRRRSERDHPRGSRGERRLPADHHQYDEPASSPSTEPSPWPAPEPTSATTRRRSRPARFRRSARPRSPSARCSPTRTFPIPNGNSTLYGPGFVAPVGIKGHFPPGHHVHAPGRPVQYREHQPR